MVAAPRRAPDRAAAGGSASRLLEVLVEIEAAHAQRRHQPEDDAGHDGDRQREQEHLAVDGDVAEARDAARSEGADAFERPDREDQPERPASDRERHALSEQLADDAAAAGARSEEHTS